MNSKIKNDKSILIGILVFVSTMLVFISIPLVSYAQTGTLGGESPEIYCTYAQDGVAVDGNKLTAGTYDVNFMLSDMSAVSVFEVTATYDTEQVSIESTPTALISDDTDSGFESMGYILSDGNIVFGFVSTNEDCSPINVKKQVIATVKMTFASDCDAGDYITVSQNPNLTFAQADYGDGYDDEYSLTDSFDGYNGTLYPMTCDVTPIFGFDVSGELVIMTDSNGSTNNLPVYGEYTVDVYADSDRSDLVTSVTSVYDSAENKNAFNIENLIDGTYYATISSEYSIPRNITIIVSRNDISAGMIPMICCEYNKDGGVTSEDAKLVFSAAATGNLVKYFDLNGDGGVTSEDAKTVFKFALSSKYDDLIIK